tara:strand:- start:2041 stop:2256 length:216 start_codon:yes stop_codon:yes gene_type:complete
MVEHEIAMAISHLKEWHQRNPVISCEPKSWIAVECALSWLQDAQDKMDAERKTREQALKLLDVAKQERNYK